LNYDKITGSAKPSRTELNLTYNSSVYSLNADLTAKDWLSELETLGYKGTLEDTFIFIMANTHWYLPK
jgi:hypothetical protein